MGVLGSVVKILLLHVVVVVGLLGYELYFLVTGHSKYPGAAEDPEFKMNAAQFTEVGDASVIKLRQIPRPACCSDTQILVKVLSAAINPVDFKQRRNPNPEQMVPLPKVTGYDFAGTVEKIGTNVRSFRDGDAVYGMLPLMGQRWGAVQEYVVVDHSIVAHAPKSIPLREAAALPLVGLTVVQSFEPVVKVWRSNPIEQQRKVLIQAGAGGVGTFGIQYAAQILNASVATTASAKKSGIVKDLGASVVVNYREQKFEEVLTDYDAVLDVVTQEYEERTLASAVLKPGGKGHYINVLSTDWKENDRESSVVFALAPFLKKWVYWALALSGRGVHYHCNPVAPSGEGLRHIADWVDAGLVKPIIDRSFEMSETAKAHEYLETGRATGKVLIDVSQ